MYLKEIDRKESITLLEWLTVGAFHLILIFQNTQHCTLTDLESRFFL